MLPVLAAELLVACRQKNQVGNRKTQREDLHCRKTMIQEHLRAYEARAPKGDGNNGEQMPKGETVARGYH